MDVLHLSDLHLREDSPERTLDELWSAPAAALAPERARFDVIVVSGDLTQRAEPEEYEGLLTFSRRCLLPLLKDDLPGPAVKRIIFVPGNHDVSWSAPIERDGRGHAERGDVATAEEIWRHSERDQRRAEIHADGIRIHHLADPATYAKRLEACQAFLDAFYGDALATAPDRRFDLRQPAAAGQDWSAHVFADGRGESIAFFGFNSCHANDRYWRGGHVNPAAIANAQRVAHGALREHMKIAVWHHGLASDRGRPDYLALSEIGPIQDLGCRLAFHGHVHKAGREIRKLVRDRITIVATGSLGAGRSDRPEMVCNQFSVVRIHPTRAAVSVYARSSEANQYERGETEMLPLHGLPASAHGGRPSAASIVRDFRVGEDGITRIRLAMNEVDTHGASLPLSVLFTPSRQIAAEQAWVDGASTPVSQKTLSDGSIRFWLPETQRRARKLEWEYLVANALALTQEDLLRKERPALYPNLGIEEDAIGYLVRVECDRLELHLEFERSGPAAELPVIGSARPLVERKSVEGGEERWIPIESENERCSVDASSHSGSLRVDAPIPDVRYSLVYKPAQRGPRLSADAKDLAARLLRLTRTDPTRGPTAIALLSRCVAAGVSAALGQGPATEPSATPPSPALPGLEGPWVGYLWNAERKALQPAFGDLTPGLWGERFGSGVGVVGHAFRFGASALWWRGGETAARASIVFLEHDDPPVRADWVVAVPLLVATGRAAIGVVAFGGPRPAGNTCPASEALATMARDLVELEEAQRKGDTDLTPPDTSIERRRALLEAANLYFWSAIAEGAIFGNDDRRFAASVLERSVRGTDTASGHPVEPAPPAGALRPAGPSVPAPGGNDGR